MCFQKQYLFALFLSLLSCSVWGQKTIKIEYERNYLTPLISPVSVDGVPQTIPHPTDLKARLLVNDSFAFINYYFNQYDPLKKKAKEFGKKIIHHGIFYDFKKKEQYSLIDIHKDK